MKELLFYAVVWMILGFWEGAHNREALPLRPGGVFDLLFSCWVRVKMIPKKHAFVEYLPSRGFLPLHSPLHPPLLNRLHNIII